MSTTHIPAGSTHDHDDPLPSGWSRTAVEGAFEVLHRKWTVALLLALWDHDLRYHQLEHGLRIKAKVLSESLRGLERDGLVTRVFGPGTPAPVMYSLTPLARSLGSVLHALQDWSLVHLDEVHECRRQKTDEAAAPELALTLG